MRFFPSFRMTTFQMPLKVGVLILFLATALQSISETILVGGTMEESETWTNENTYLVIQDLIVPNGVILTIEEGVLVKINNSLGIIVDEGIIKVQGTKTDSVNFIPNYSGPGQIWKWSGLVIRNASVENKSYIQYARLVDAETAIKIKDSWEVVIENSSIFNCQNLGVNIINSSSCFLLSCNIENNYDGIEIFTEYSESSSSNVIYDCIIRNQNHNIYISGEAGSIYQNNSISGNLIESGNNGIWIANSDGLINSENIIEQNLILNNGAGVGYGLFLAHHSTIVRRNIFWKNNIAIFSEAKGDNCLINNNSFYQNNWAISVGAGSEGNEHLNNTFSLNSTELLGIKETQNVVFRRNNLLHNTGLENIVINNTPVDLSIIENFWGTTDTSQIHKFIYDNLDNPTLGKLSFIPFLDNLDTSNPISPPYRIIKQIIDNKVQISWHTNKESDLMGYRMYYGIYGNYSFSQEDEAGTDTIFVFPGDISINDPFAVTAFDSVAGTNNAQLSGHESPFAFASIYPYAGSDTIICQHVHELKIENVTIPFPSQGLFWSTSGDGFFNKPNSPSPTYFPGILDIQNYGVILALNVKTVAGDTLTDEFTLSIFDNPIAFAGNDTIVFEDEDIHLVEASAINFESIIWITNGDGNFDNNTLVNPTYFPGDSDNELGVVLLEMMVYSSCGSASDSVTILIEPYYSVEGKLWASQKAVNPGIVIAFIENDVGTRAVQIESVEYDGTFKFEKLMEGNYYMYALPDTNNYDYIVPGYYANKLRWQSAYLLPVDANVYDIDIYLPSTDFVLPIGIASISGHMDKPSDTKYNSDIYCTPWFENSNNNFCRDGLSNITVLLYDRTETKLLDYTLTDDNGNFYFNQLPFGNYIVDAEKAGYLSFPSPLITLSPEHAHETNVILQINQKKIGISLSPTTLEDINATVFPNPASTEINILFSNPLLLRSQLEIFDLRGNRVLSYNILIENTSSTIKLDIIGLSSGLYFGQIVNSSQIIHFRFVKRVNVK